MTVFLIVLIVIFLILMAPVGAAAEYSADGFEAVIKAGPLVFSVYPPKKDKKEKKQEKDNEKKPKKGGSFELIKNLLPEALRALDAVRRGIVINELTVHFTSASDNPCKTAMNFGYANMAVGMIVPPIQNAFKVKKRNITTAFSFEDKSSTVYLKAIITMPIVTALKIALTHGVKMLNIYSETNKREKIRKAE